MGRGSIALAVGIGAAVVLAACGGGGTTVRTEQGRHGVGASQVAVAAVTGDEAPGGLTATGQGKATVRADVAYLVLGPAGPDDEGVSISAGDRAKIVDALGELGIAEEDVEVGPSGSDFVYGDEVQAEVPVDAVAELGPKAESAVEEVVGRTAEHGVRFAVADCATKAAPARRAAVLEARADAKSLAAATGVQLGAVTAVVEVPTVATQFGADDPCEEDPAFTYGADVRAYGAQPDVDLRVGVAVTFAIDGPSAAGGLTATGDGAVTVDADQAIVVVGPSFDELPGDNDGFEEDRERLKQALADLGVTDVRIENSSVLDFGAGPIVRAKVAVGDVAELGPDIVDAVDEVTGSVGESGVLFSSSRCTEFLADAQRAAAEDAQGRIRALADDAGVGVGRVSRVVGGAGGAELFGGFVAGSACGDPLEATPGGLADLGGFYDESTPSLEAFSAPARVTIEASVTLTQAVAD